MPKPICNACLGMLVNGSEPYKTYQDTGTTYQDTGYFKVTTTLQTQTQLGGSEDILYTEHNKQQELFIAKSILM